MSALRLRWPCARCSRRDECAATVRALRLAVDEALRDAPPGWDVYVDCGRYSPASRVLRPEHGT